MLKVPEIEPGVGNIVTVDSVCMQDPASPGGYRCTLRIQDNVEGICTHNDDIGLDCRQDGGMAHILKCTCIHLFFHIFIHSYIHSFIHSYIHTFIHSYIHSFTHSHIHTFIHSYIHTFIIYYLCIFLAISFYKGINQAVLISSILSSLVFVIILLTLALIIIIVVIVIKRRRKKYKLKRQIYSKGYADRYILFIEHT